MIYRKPKGARTDKLKCVEHSCFETCVCGCEYYSPKQRGGIYGPVYRQYFTTLLPSDLTSGNKVSRLIDHSMIVTDGTNRYLFRGWADRAGIVAAIYLTGTSGNGNLMPNVAGMTLQDGWVEYTK